MDLRSSFRRSCALLVLGSRALRPPGRARSGEAVPRQSGDGVRQRPARDRIRRSRDDRTRRRRRWPRRGRRRLRLQLRVAHRARARCVVRAVRRARRRSRRGLDLAVRGEARRRQGRADGGPSAGRCRHSISAATSTLDLGYAADAVSGATATTYQVDAVSSATKFSDVRHEGTLALGFQGRRSQHRRSRRRFGTERDYLSRRSAATPRSTCPAATRRRARVQPQLRRGLRPRQRQCDAARAPRADRRRPVPQVAAASSARTIRA